MRKTVTAALLSAVLLSVAGISAAQEHPPVIKNVAAQGLKVHKSFPGPSGLTGWVLMRESGDPLVVFSTADGKTLVSGALIDETGNNMLEGYVEAHVPKVTYQQHIAALNKAEHIVQGDPKGKQVIYAFFDPACPYCNAAYGTFKQSLKPGQQVRWIPVAFLSQRSQGQAAAMMQSKDPAAAMLSHEASFKSGGIEGVTASAEVSKSLASNLELFRAMGFKGVPAIIYQSGDGKWLAVKGAPQPGDLQKILGAKK